jgi:hypothetical protein
MRRQSSVIASAKIGLMIAAAAAAFAFTSPAHANPFTASCSGGGTSLTCTFVSGPGELFIDGQAADINLSSTSIITNATETFTGGTATASNFEFNSTNPVDGLGHFTVVDNLTSTSSPGNPTASTITITITGSNLALASNELGNTFAAHICEVSTGTACSSTFFTTPSPVPAPIVGAGLPGVLMACGGLVALSRRRRQKTV